MIQSLKNCIDILPSHSLSSTWRVIERCMPPKRSAEERVGDFAEIYGLYSEETVKQQAARCLQCASPACVTGCPLSNRIPEWLALTAAGCFLEAAEVSQSTSNFPEICARICPQERLCEGACVLESRTEPVSIGAIEQFINEYAFRHNAVAVQRPPTNGLRVAVVGAGPAGLACADQLAKVGYAVTVFEAKDRAGGLLLYGIPAFKLDKGVVARRVSLLRKRGVDFVFGAKVGKTLSLGLLLADYHAVFWGVGAQRPKPAGVAGADLNGVHEALPFLIQKNDHEHSSDAPIDVRGKRVAVLGGGDTAMDCLRTALRCGAAGAVCLYRRDRDNMPGSRKEFFNASEEGAEFRFLVNPVEIMGNAAGCVTAVRCIRMKLGEPDAGGRRKPIPVPDSEFTVATDVVLIAYGFDPVPIPGTAMGPVQVNDWGGIVLDENGMSSIPGLFSGGDALHGPNLVSVAVGDGRRAAAAIDRWLQRKPDGSAISSSYRGRLAS